MKVQIPGSIDEAKERLNGLDRLLTAQGWERAALVYAFTRDGERGDHWSRKRDQVDVNIDIYSCLEFADLGIHGLLHHDTVRKHRNNWKLAIEKEWAVHIEPSDEVELPEADYPPTGNGGGYRDVFTAATPAAEKIEAVKKLMQQEPDVRKGLDRDFVERASRDTGLASRVRMTWEEQHPRPEPKQTSPNEVGDLELAVLMGVGVSIYVKIQQHSERVQRYAKVMEARQPLTDQLIRIMEEDLADLEKSRDLIAEYEDVLRKSIGRDANATFRRLVGE